MRIIVLALFVTVFASAATVTDYLETCRVPDGTYAWPGDEDGHLELTHAAVGVYHVLGKQVPGDAAALAERCANRIPWERKPVWRTREHWQSLKHVDRMRAELCLWLGREPKEVRNQIAASPVDVKSTARGNWNMPDAYTKAYEMGENPVMVEEMNKLVTRRLVGLDVPPATRARYRQYLDLRRRADGSYNTTRTSEGGPGHVFNTWWAFQGLEAMGVKPDAGIDVFVEGCRTDDGGYTWTDDRTMPGRVSDIVYARAAVKLLAMVGKCPRHEDALRTWIASLRNPDGGFGDRPGARSNPLATYAVVETLQSLGALDVLTNGCGFVETARPRAASGRVVSMKPPEGVHAWTIQFQAPGEGSVREAVEVARMEKIHLWGAKNAKPEWLAAAQAEADRRGVKVVFFRSDEHYGAVRAVPGLGRFTHIEDPVTPPPGSKDVRPFELWQACDHECMVRVMLDSGRYDAIGTFHFGMFDMSWTNPFTRRYEDTIAHVNNQDAHGETWWWRHLLHAHRTVFLAREPSFDAFREACRNHLVASVRRDEHTAGRLRMIGCASDVKDAFRKRREDWTAEPVEGAAVSIQVIGPEDRFEVARPEKGRVIRVRYDRPWVESRGLQSADYRLEKVTLAGRELPIDRHEIRHVSNDYLNGNLEDAYDLIVLPEDISGTAEFDFGSFRRTIAIDQGTKH